MTAYSHIAHRLFGVPLLVEATYASVVLSVLASRLDTEPTAPMEKPERFMRPDREAVFYRDAGIAVVPIVGGTVHRGAIINPPSGLQSYTATQNLITSLVGSPAVRGILLDIDSCGGEAAGIAEFSKFLTDIGKDIPVWAAVNTTACSAAYWIACSADRVYAAKHSRVGSIGVYVVHQDVSKAMAKRGVVTSFVYAGKHKIDGNPFAPLPDDVRASMQAGVDALYCDFVAHVADRRELADAVVRKTEAAVFGPEQALDLGLIDGIASFGDVAAALSEHVSEVAR